MKSLVIVITLLASSFAFCQQMGTGKAEQQRAPTGSCTINCSAPSSSQDTKWFGIKPIELGQILALFAAVIFFLYKALSGYLISDMSVKVACERKHADKEIDYLAILVTAKKGERGGVKIHDARARVRPETGASVPGEPQELIGIRRLDRTKRKPFAIIWKELSGLNLPPGDEMQFASLFRVPCGSPCTVEVVIMAKKFWQTKPALGQWRTSYVSLPHDVLTLPEPPKAHT